MVFKELKLKLMEEVKETMIILLMRGVIYSKQVLGKVGLLYLVILQVVIIIMEH